MFKYAKYIHNLPKTEDKNIKKDENSESGMPSNADEEK